MVAQEKPRIAWLQLGLETKKYSFKIGTSTDPRRKPAFHLAKPAGSYAF